MADFPVTVAERPAVMSATATSLMADRKLRLVHSADSSVDAVEGREEWWFENAKQHGFFDDLDKIKVHLVPLWELNANSFKKMLAEYSPRVLIETRLYPDFFMIFGSIGEARREFDSRDIDYHHVPLFESENPKENWSQWLSAKSILGGLREKRNGDHAVLLTSSWLIHDRLMNSIKEYLSQDANNKIEILGADIPRPSDSKNNNAATTPKGRHIRGL